MSSSSREPMPDPRPMFSEAAEQAVLSAMLLDGAVIPSVEKRLSADAFYRPAHRRLFSAMATIAGRGETVDPLTLSAEIERAGALDSVGGREFIGYLVDVVPTAANVEYHAKIVHRHAQRRHLVDAADRMRTMAMQDGAEPDEIARQVQAETLSIAVDDQDAGFREVTNADIRALAEAIELRGLATAAGKYPGMATGYPEIDDVTQGFRPRELVIFGAVPKAWKTALADNITLNMLRDGRVCGKVAAEMSREETLERMLAAEASVTHSALARGTLTHEEWKRFFVAARNIENRFHVDDEAFPELSDVVARCTELKARVPAVELIVVDYLQLVTARLHNKRGDEEIHAVCRALKGLAKRLNVLLIAPAQANYKEIEARSDKRPEARDLQGSSGMAQTANFVGMLYSEQLYDANAKPELEINFVLSRRTPRFTARLRMYPDYQLLRSRRAA